MKPSSAKNKGRILCKQVKVELLKLFPTLEEDDIKVTSSGATGEDLQLSPQARKLFPYTIECKSRSGIAVYAWLEQATREKHTPIVVAKANHKPSIVVLYAEDFYKLIGEVHAIKEN
jgi:hypothetical protein